MRALIGMVLLLSLAACAEGWRQETALRARPLDSDQQCSRDLPTANATWVDNPVDFKAAYQQLNRLVIEALITVPQVDFEKEGVLFIEMGRRPTAGYGISLAEEAVPVVGDAAQVTVHWSEPQPGQVAAQVITSPCAFIALTRDDYRRIEVHDDTGQLRAVAPRHGG